MKTNDGERLEQKPEKHIRHLVLNARDLPRHLAFDLTFETGSCVGNATSLALLRHYLAFTCIRRAGQRASGIKFPLTVYAAYAVATIRCHQLWVSWRCRLTDAVTASPCCTHCPCCYCSSLDGLVSRSGESQNTYRTSAYN